MIDALGSVTAERDVQGNIVRSRSVFINVTEHKRAEKALRESEERYRAVFTIASVGIDLVDRQGKFLEVNSTLARFLGYSPEELRHLTIRDITHPEDVTKSWEMHEALVQGKTQRYRLEKRYVRKDGSILWADTAVSAIRDDSRQYRATVGVISDITDRKKLEEARIRLGAAVEQAAETVEITDPQGTIVYVNPSFERTTGYSSEEAIGKNPRILKSSHHDDAFYKGLWDSITNGKVWTGHFINKKKDGTLFEEDVSISPVKDDSGKIVNYVAVKRDVTREVSLQSQLFQAQKMEAVGTLAGGVAHDFNNILQVVLGYSELLLSEKKLPKEFREDLAKMNLAARNGADLVKQLLTFSRKAEIKPLHLNLNGRIEQLQKMLSRTISKMIKMELVLTDDLWSINADPTQVDQVLMNLALNARDAMPDGGKLIIETKNVTLDEDYARSHLEAKPGSYVLLSISDTGQGMDKETVQHIFEPFFTTKGPGEGTGLGLATVYGIVKHHGGYITCYSEQALGTTLRLYFPAVISDEHSIETAPRTLPRGGSETILLVDDEVHIRDLGSRILAKGGYRVITASNGQEALEMYRTQINEIALVILDLIMPEMAGKQCLEGLLRLDSSAKVVIASGYSANGPTKEALSAGAKGFVNKPYDMRQLLEVVRAVLDGE